MSPNRAAVDDANGVRRAWARRAPWRKLWGVR